MAALSIHLGAHDYKVRPQKIGYLMHRLGPSLQEALEAEIEGVEGIRLVGAKAHEALGVFIPDLMPVYEFLGYASEEAMRAGNYVEEDDRSPDAPQIETAFAAVKKVNGGQVLDHLKAVAGAMAPELKQKVVSYIVAKLAEQGATTLPSPTPAPSQT